MGVMEKMRASTKYILWVLIFSFVILWSLADTQVFDALQAGPSAMGEVNGKPISFQAYDQKLQTFLQRYQYETGNSAGPELRAYYEEQAWDELVLDILIKDEMERLGITVSDQEIVDMVTGPNPDPFIAQQFTDENGQLNRQALQAAIMASENTPVWIQIEQQFRDSRRREKLANFLQSSTIVTDTEIENAFLAENTTVTFDYIRVPYSSITDSMISFSESDLRKFYNQNKERYKQKQSWKFKYVTYDKTPTPDDTSRVYNEMLELRSVFADTENDSLFLLRYESFTQYATRFVKKNELKELYKPVLSLDKGEVTELLISENDELFLLKKLDETKTEIKFVEYGRKIIADPVLTVDAQAKEADDFAFFAETEGFNEEAERRGLTLLSGVANEGTPFIAGLGQSRQVLNFLSANKERTISEALELQDKFIVLVIDEHIKAGYRPFEEVQSQVKRLYKNDKRKEMVNKKIASVLSTNSDFKAIAAELGVEPGLAEDVKVSSEIIPGVGREPILAGSLAGLESGVLSPIIQGDNAVFIIRIKTKNEADFNLLTAQSKSTISTRLKQEKNNAISQIWIEELKESADIKDYRSYRLKR